jgi:hypothetical protein
LYRYLAASAAGPIYCRTEQKLAVLDFRAAVKYVIVREYEFLMLWSRCGTADGKCSNTDPVTNRKITPFVGPVVTDGRIATPLYFYSNGGMTPSS